MSFDSGRPVVAPSVGLARSSRVGFGTVANADTNADFVRPEAKNVIRRDGSSIRSGTHNDENNVNSRKAPPSDREIKDRARAEARAGRPGVVSVAADEAARFDQRIANKQGRAPSHKPPADLAALEDQIAAKTRAATVPAPIGMSSLEDRIQAKVRGNTLSRKPPPPAAATDAFAASPRQGGAVMSMEERIQAKIRRDGGGGGGARAPTRDQLQGLDARITAKQREYEGVKTRNEPDQVSRLEERIAAKKSTASFAAMGTNEMSKLKTPSMESYPESLRKGELFDSGPTPDPLGKRTDEYPDQAVGHKVPIDENSAEDQLANPHQGGTDLEYGVYDASENPEGLAVAVPVMEEEEDVFIPSAVEYDPDAKPPIYRNRRFRLYAFLAVLVLAMVAVGTGVGVHLSTDGEYDPMEAFAHRENLGIREAIERTVGAEVLEDETSPYSKALRWIMYQDPMELDPEAPNFLQRYILAYFYHATSVDKPWISCNPPTEDMPDSCLWNKIQQLVPVKRVEVPSFRWLSGVSECVWAGIFCDDFNQTRSIDLLGSDLTGSFPTGVVHLTYLQSLSLIWGSLAGPLPTEISQMKHLVNIELQQNAFTGSIPQEWWESRSLQRINLGRNQLSGPISDTIRSMRDAKGLYLFENMMTGTIPTTMGLLNSLSFFRVDTNFLQGNIPSDLGLIKSLRSLGLHVNDFSGTIPSELANCPQLEDLRVNDNTRLTGEIPGEMLPKLNRLHAFNCDLFGNMTEKFSLMESMVTLKLDNNTLGGTLPDDLGASMPNLIEMTIAGNDFTGVVPDSLCELVGLANLMEMVADCAAPAGESAEIFCPEGCCTACCDAAGENCSAQHAGN